MHSGLHIIAAFGISALFTLSGCGDSQSFQSTPSYPNDDTLRLNQIQVLGTHNSYHVQAVPEVFALFQHISPTLARGVEYTHLPLDQQFENQGIRQIELDVWADPQGGLYADPRALRLAHLPPPDDPDLLKPGFKILHIQDLDFNVTCSTFVKCLTVVKGWSDSHPGHVPINIHIEAKDDQLPGSVWVVPIPIGKPELDALDAEIRSVFPAEQIITPDEVRGTHDTLEEAIHTDGWPTLAKSRGRVLFTFDNEDHYKADYIDGHPSLRGRILFVSAGPGEPEAAYIKLNDPIGDFDTIQKPVAQGFIVRTRADADTEEARSGNTEPRDHAIASGAQFVSTDYPVPNPAFGTGYFVAIPGGTPARCNPISAPATCTSLDVENPAHLTSR